MFLTPFGRGVQCMTAMTTVQCVSEAQLCCGNHWVIIMRTIVTMVPSPSHNPVPVA